ncbi:MAG TPA: alpha/beta hydrolase [Verrucomicrobia bacterium]|nr:alpha/beta hydrolase [Verrucomicrobiales bacterium]HIL55611.1 alpha/beta hydrolase [Verrucomicrobiota bacterium]
MKTVLGLCFSLLFLSLLKAEDKSPPKPDRSRVLLDMNEGIIREPHIMFTYVDEKKRRRLTLDLYRPAKTETPSPAIIMYFGGGWQNGRPGIFASLAQGMAQRGYVCVVPEYRLSGEKPFPAAVHDCKAAIRWTRRNAKRFNINPNRIASMGGSAGGHLAGFMATTNGVKRFEGQGSNRDFSSNVQAAIVMCGPMTLLLPHIIERVEKAAGKPEGDAIIDFMGGALPAQKTGIYIEASPLTHVSAQTPPMLFIDGEFDRPRTRYTEFWTKMDNYNIPHEFVLMPKAPHPFWNMREWFIPTLDGVDNFLKKHLQKK